MKIQHLNCSICNKQITEKINKDEVFGMVFRVTRSKESYTIEKDGDLSLDDSNEKMSMEFCEKCFVKILNESKILGSLFINKEKNCFIY